MNSDHLLLVIQKSLDENALGFVKECRILSEDSRARALLIRTETQRSGSQCWRIDAESIQEVPPPIWQEGCPLCGGLGWYPAWGGMNFTEEVELPCPECTRDKET